ncbi:MAG: hypothetical protein ACLFQE_01115 [Thermotogota bacterium]
MRKALLTVLLVSVIVFVSISFMGASCTVTPGPGPTLYTLTVTNQSGDELRLEIHDDLIFDWIVRQAFVGNSWNASNSIAGEAGYYLRVRNLSTGSYLEFSSGNTWWYITGSQSFTVTGGGWVTEAR